MAESASGQGDANSVLIGYPSDQERLVFALGISRVGPASESSVFGRIINTLLTTLVW